MIQRKKLGEIANISAGQGAPQGAENYSEQGTPFVKAGDLLDLVNGKPECDIQKVSEQVAKNHKLKLYPKGTVLFAKSGMSCLKGYVYVTNVECYVVSHLACIMPFGVDSKYLKYYFEYHKPNQLVKDASYPSISLADIAGMPINIFDDHTQAKIVGNLDAVNNLIVNRKKELSLLDQLVKSRFIELFYDKGYPVLNWNDVFNTTTGKLDSNASVEEGAYPFFTCSKEALKIDTFAFDQKALLLAGNNAAGKYDVKYYDGKFNAYQRTYVLTLKENWSYRLFQYQLEDKLEYLQQQSLGGLTKYLTFKILGKLEFVIPPKDLQSEFETFVVQIDKSKYLNPNTISQLAIA